MKEYLDIVKEVLKEGTRKENRTGVDTISTFNINYKVDLQKGFPLLTTKEISWKNIVVENLWFLSGQTHIGLLKKHGCKFWNPWADEQGYVPSAYGNFWRQFPVPSVKQDGQEQNNTGNTGNTGNADKASSTAGHYDNPFLSTNEKGTTVLDQIRWVINELKTNPNSRRLVISAWSPGNTHQSALPPCHLLWILNVQKDKDGVDRLNLHLTQRSADVALGVPYNIAGYSFLVHLFCRFTGLKPGFFAHTMVDAHIYTAKADGSMPEYDHIPGLEEQLTRIPLQRPTFTIDESIQTIDDIDKILDKDTDELLKLFKLEGYAPHQALKFKVAV